MKKLNRKGFTLIELLAVIVILAIIVVVTVPTIISTIADARVSSIWNLAGSVANSYDTVVAQDLLASNPTILNGMQATSDWQCIMDLVEKDADDNIVEGGKTLVDVLNLSSTDVKLDGNKPNGTITGNECSAIKLKSNGMAEVLLVAKDGGKFAISGKKVYALSSEPNGHQD